MDPRFGSLTPLKQIQHPMGDIFHAMKSSDPGYDGFGEAYFSTVHQGSIKAWKQHTSMTLNLVVPVGQVQFVMYDETTQAFDTVSLSQHNYQRLTVPPMIWVGFKGIDHGLNLILNLANIPHDPAESNRKALEDIHYDW